MASERSVSLLERPGRKPPLSARLAVTAIVVALFLTAFYLPAFWARGGFFEGGTEMQGWQLLAFGWLPFFTIAWFANPLLLDSMRRFWRGESRVAMREAGVAVGFGLTPALYVWLDEPGWSELYAGYYLWLGSLVTAFLGAAWFALPDIVRRPRDSGHLAG
jgi:hypothetical protein